MLFSFFLLVFRWRFIVLNIFGLIQIVEENETKVSDEMSKKSYASEIESFRLLMGDSDAELLEAFISQITPGSEDSVSPIVLSPDSDKTHRTVSFLDLHFSVIWMSLQGLNYACNLFGLCWIRIETFTGHKYSMILVIREDIMDSI